MKKIIIVLMFSLMFVTVSSQTINIQIQPSAGNCLLESNCEQNIICYDILLTIAEPNWKLRSYNIWVQYPSPPLMSYNSDNSCLIQNGGDTDNNALGLYRISGINGSLPMTPGVPVIVHSFCLDYSNPLLLRDSSVKAGGIAYLYGFPFESTITLINAITGSTQGIVLQNQDTLPIMIEDQQNIELMNGWSGISGLLQPGNPDISAIMEPALNDLVIMYNLKNGIYYPAYNINTLLNWDYKSGYIIKTNNITSINYCGLDATDKTIALTAGWNLIPVLSRMAVPVETFFSPIINQLLIVKEVAGSKIYYPAYSINTLEYLVPGKAYLVNVLQNCTISFENTAGVNLTVLKDNYDLQEISPWNPVIESPETHTFCLVNDAITIFNPGDLIGAFDQNGKCSGITEVLDISHPFSLTVYGDDNTTETKDGLISGESVVFHLFRPSGGIQMDLEMSYQASSPNTGFFVTNGISVINSVIIKSTSIDPVHPSDDMLVNLFPNPTSGNVNLKFTGNSTLNGKIILTDAHGHLILDKELSHQNYVSLHKLDLSVYPAGTYYLRVKSGNFYNLSQIVKE